jgi:tetratricopeptide (TPR) repeat protein
LGWAQLIAGDIDGALTTAEEALQAQSEDAAAQPTTTAGALELRGTARLMGGKTDLAEVDFRQAIEIHRTFGAKTGQLGATVKLAHLLSSQGRREEARVMLAEIYGSFTEGFDTADLKNAKALLNELAQ